MYNKIFHMTPFLPTMGPGFQDMIVDIFEKSSALSSRLHPVTMQGLIDFLRMTNTYYSNLIEGHITHPVDIERAMEKQFDQDPAIRELQMEARVHVELERKLDNELSAGKIRLTSPEYVRAIHRRFYEKLPQSFRKIGDPEEK